ncbi:MAG: hypothetical protein RL677_367 [Actinomycetota bacterium]|jgi:hypothetical protein
MLITTELRVEMKRFFAATLSTLLIFAGSSSAAQAVTYSSSQQAAIKALFKAFATSQPAKIQRAVNARTAAGSDARLFGNLVKNHFESREYLKSVDNYGNISPEMQDPRGSYRYKNGRVTLNSYFDFFDGIYTNFKFNSAGKITSFSKRDAKGATKRLLADSIYSVTVNYDTGGLEIKEGTVLINSDGKVFTQLKLYQEYGGLLSWTERGNYRSPDGSVQVIDSIEPECMTNGGVAYYESLGQTPSVVAPATVAVVTLPLQYQCAKTGSDRHANVLITTN